MKNEENNKRERVEKEKKKPLNWRKFYEEWDLVIKEIRKTNMIFLIKKNEECIKGQNIYKKKIERKKMKKQEKVLEKERKDTKIEKVKNRTEWIKEK